MPTLATQLAAAVNATQAKILVDDAAAKDGGFYVQIDEEILLVERGGATIRRHAVTDATRIEWQVKRGQFGTVAASHADDEAVTEVVPSFQTGDPADPPAESGGGGEAATRASLSLDTTDSPQFAGVNVGHATDTTIARASAGNLTVEGNALYRAGGTDVPVTDGGTGASSASGARTNLGVVIGTDVPGQAAFDDHSARHEAGGADEIDLTGLSGAGSPAEIVDIPTAEMDDSLVLAPDGAGGVEFRAESGGGGAPTIIRGRVNSDGTVAAGSGFTSARDAAGKYTVTFDSAFGATPIVVLEPTGSVAWISQVHSASTTTFEAWFDNASTFQDVAFMFIAVAV